MMIPTISIDGVSMPVTRDGTNLMPDMPLGTVASQVLEQGIAFEAAVEQFQRAMSEIPVLANGTPAITNGTPAITNGTPAPRAPTVVQERALPASVATSCDPPADKERSPSAPLGWDNGHLARCGNAGIANDVTSVPVGFPASLAPVVVASCDTPVVLPAGEDLEAAGRRFPQVETGLLSVPQAVTDPSPDLFQTGTAPSPGLVPTAAVDCDSPAVGSDVPPSGGSGVSPLHETSPSPLASSVASQPAVMVQQPVATVPSEQHPSVQTADLQGDQLKPASTPAPPAAVAVDEPDFVQTETAVEEIQDTPVLQAAPMAMPAQPQVIDVKDVAAEPVQVVAARVVHKVMATPAQVLIEAASAVADTIVVSPGLLRGTGEVQVQLRPDVLEGTVIRISTTTPGSLTVQFTPVNENMAALLEKCAPQLVTYLSERVHSVQIAVNVKRDEKLKG